MQLLFPHCLLPRLLRAFFAAAIALPVLFHCGAQQARIGVLANWANWGVEKCVEDWTPMILALRQALPGVDFTLVPLTFEAVEDAVLDARAVDEALYHANRLGRNRVEKSTACSWN